MLVTADNSTSCLELDNSLPRQGEVLWDTLDSIAANVWSLAVGNLTSTSTKFILNAASDKLPHNCNLKL